MTSARGVSLTQGEKFVLFPSAVRATAAANVAGTRVWFGGERRRFLVLLDVTAAANAAGDTLDVYVDWSLDTSTWFNGCRFTQVLGDGGAKKFFTVFDASTGLTADVEVSADAAVHTTRPATFGPYVRGRYTITDSGGHLQSFTFSLKGYAL